MSERQAQRYRAAGEETIRALRAERLRALSDRSAAAAKTALTVLCGLLENEAMGGMIRVVAAGKVLDVALKLHERFEVEERLQAVEAALEAQLTKGNR